MAEPVWYYARGEVERGPFTLLQIKALANASKVRPDDLVWREGMENWTAAREVTELFPPAGLIGDSAVLKGPGFGTETRSVPKVPGAASALELSNDLQNALRRVVRGLAVLGVVLILGTRGCESLGDRHVARLHAMAEISELEKSANAEAEKLAAAKSTLDHQKFALARGVALYLGLLVLLGGATGMMLLTDRHESWFGLGVILVVILSLLETLV